MFHEGKRTGDGPFDKNTAIYPVLESEGQSHGRVYDKNVQRRYLMIESLGDGRHSLGRCRRATR